MKLLLINESFYLRALRRRWFLLAQKHSDMEVIIVIPKLGKTIEAYDDEVLLSNYHIEEVSTKQRSYFGWTSPDFKKILKKWQPDIVYNIGTHDQLCGLQVMHLTKSMLPSAKFISFSMRGPCHNIKHRLNTSGSFKQKVRRYSLLPFAKCQLWYFNRNCDAVFCHYSEAERNFREEGYNGPIYLQTQVGVNPEQFCENSSSRESIRKKYGLGDTFVFGSATRFIPGKGLEDIIKALPKDKDYKFLMMGSGSVAQVAWVKNLIQKENLQDKIILTGFVQNKDMPDYWNAVDCAVHVPKTTSYWVETFSVALVQAMATRRPVIADDSGSVPYQVGDKGLIIHEGDINDLTNKFNLILENKEYRDRLAEDMYDRAVKCFGIFHLNDLFYETLVHDVMNGTFSEKYHDMAVYNP